MTVSRHTAQAYRKASYKTKPGSNQVVWLMQISMTPGMYHDSGPFPVVFSDEMRLKPRFGCYFLSAYRAAPFLVVPDFDEFFPSFGTIQHSFSVTFLIISRPSFIERVSFGGDFSESDDFSICRVFQFEVFFIEIFTAESRLCCKRPRSVINMMPVFVGNPFPTFSLVSAASPPP